jgi:transposase
MSEAFIIGIDLAKRVFQIHGADAAGKVLYRRKLSRPQFNKFLNEHPSCIFAMEACASAHHWGREALAAGHEVRLVPARYVKPFVKRHKSDVVDAEAITEAAMRPSMRFVPVKAPEQQAQAMLFRTRELFVRQRTQLINSLRGYLAEFGIVLRLRIRNADILKREVEEQAHKLPDEAKRLAERLLAQIETISAEVEGLDHSIKMHAKTSEETRLMQTMPGVGPMSVIAISAFCPPAKNFRTGRDFAAWLGLVPRQHSTGGKERLGRITKMGQKDVRRLLIIGAMSAINSIERWKRCAEPWLARMLETRPRMVVAVALANRMARRLWAMLMTGQIYRIRGAVA